MRSLTESLQELRSGARDPQLSSCCSISPMKTRIVAVPLAVLLGLVAQAQQPWFTDVLPIDEFAARRVKLYAAIGDALAIVPGAAERPAEAPFRQNNQFFYLSGVEAPRAVLVLDGRTRTSTLYLADNARQSRAWGPLLEPGADAARITGLESVVSRTELDAAVAAAGAAGRVIYTPHRPEVLGSGSAGDAVAWARVTASDPWDGRPSREQAFIAKLRERAPTSEIRDVDPLLDAMRFIKSAREIAVVREATRITGLGIMQALREAEPGQFEYELFAAAEYVFRKHGAQGAAYFPLSATGKNTAYSHYHRGTAKLADGDLVQFDYAPDWKYYVSDVTRVFPANGRFTPWQREWYTIYLRLYQSVMTSIRPGISVKDVIAAAVVKMDAVMGAYRFTDERIKAAASRFVERYRNSTATSLGHSIGMEVHDVGRPGATLQPGQMFTIEPAMQIPELGLAMRLEDALVITETGYENLSAFVPIEIEAIEQLMKERSPARD
jgi:Xaa-Pro aminopeptidase